MKNEALILIDIQKIYFTPGPLLLHKPKEAAGKAALILQRFREEGKTIVHIKHNFNVLSCIHDSVKPLSDEKVILKEKPSSFLGTDLHEYLSEHDITDVVIVGMMSHMCVDTTVRMCQNYGYNVTVIEDACTTQALKFNGRKIDATTVHEVFMASLDGMFAKVISSEEYL